jgi:hypothetical protein
MLLKCLPLLLVLSVSLSAAPALRVASGIKEVKAEFEALHAKKDRAGCVALWKSNAGAVLPVIDADLEGSLKLAEGKAPDAAKIATLHERALWGAAAAAEATGHPILVEYTASFVGWDDAQKQSFRAGQKAFGAAMKALQAGDGKAALEAGRECTSRALPLGDWWGAAMGLDAQGNAHKALGANEEALAAFTQARLVYHDLGLVGDEYQAARAIVDLCKTLGRNVRGRVTAEQALALAKALGDAKGAAEIEIALAGFAAK